MAGKWYVQVMGETSGPKTERQLVTMIQKGRLSPDDWVRRGKDSDWKSVFDFEFLFERARTEPQQPELWTGSTAPAANSTGNITPAAQRRTDTKTIASSYAKVSLWTGIPGILCFPAGVVAIVFGILGLKEIKESGTAKPGKEMAIAGITLGSIGLFLSVIALLVPDDPSVAHTPSSDVATSQHADSQKAEASPRRPENAGAKKWYEGGTLHSATALEWQTADEANKLATCSDFVAKFWEDRRFKPSIQNSMNSTNDFLPYATGLVSYINAAANPHPDPEMNRTIFANLSVAEIAAIGVLTMEWLDD